MRFPTLYLIEIESEFAPGIVVLCEECADDLEGAVPVSEHAEFECDDCGAANYAPVPARGVASPHARGLGGDGELVARPTPPSSSGGGR